MQQEQIIIIGNKYNSINKNNNNSVCRLWNGMMSAICCRKHLKQHGLLDKTYVAQKVSSGDVTVPVTEEFVRSFSSHSTQHVFKDVEFQFSSMDLRRKPTPRHPRDDLLSAVKLLCENRSLWCDDLEADLPGAWEKHGDMLLLPSNCFLLDFWQLLGNSNSALFTDLICCASNFASSCCRVSSMLLNMALNSYWL